MLSLPDAADAIDSPRFPQVLRRELRRLPPGSLPLQQALTRSSHALEDAIDVTVISVTRHPGFTRARVGVFYAGIIAGCSCADDPTPVESQPEYCELWLDIDRRDASTRVTLLGD